MSLRSRGCPISLRRGGYLAAVVAALKQNAVRRAGLEFVEYVTRANVRTEPSRHRNHGSLFHLTNTQERQSAGISAVGLPLKLEARFQ